MCQEDFSDPWSQLPKGGRLQLRPWGGGEGMGEFSLSCSKQIKMRTRMFVFELYSHLRLETGWHGRDQGFEE